jgi:Major Facilitator Superfamily
VGSQHAYSAAVVLIYGATWAPMFGSISTMLNGLTRESALQQRAFAVNFATQNMAIGIGAAVAAVVVRAHHPGTFQVLFLANGLSCLLFAALLPALPNLRRTRVVNETRVGYRYVLSHRGLRLMILASLLLAFIGPGSFDSGVPAFASVADHISFHAIALSFTINTGVIVAIQMLVLRLVRRHRRSSALAAVGLIFAVSWALFGFAEVVDGPGWRIVILFAFVGLFAVGETLLALIRNPLINSLANDRIRGRANSISGFAISLMMIVSPAIVTSLLGAHLGAVWIALLFLASLGVVAIAARLRVILTAEQEFVKQPPVAESALVEQLGDLLEQEGKASTRRWSRHESSGLRCRGKHCEVRAALYDRPGPAREVLRLAEGDRPEPDEARSEFGSNSLASTRRIGRLDLARRPDQSRRFKSRTRTALVSSTLLAKGSTHHG